jgi:hypothetical protein
LNTTANFASQEDGAVMVEMTIVLPLLLTLLLGFVDFGYAFYQWNAADKAVQVGARLAQISDPIASALPSVIASLPSGKSAGDTFNAGIYDFVCIANGAGTASCANCSGNQCTPSTATQAAFDLIYDGDGGRPGMHDFFPGLAKSEVRVEYAATGLDYWTRPGGPVPTIKVSIEGHQFQFFFLGALLNFAGFTMPDMLSTATGEDLDSASP